MDDDTRCAFRHGAFVALVMAATFLSTAATVELARAQSPQPGNADAKYREVDIPAQPLARALVTFSRQARLQIFIDQALVAGKSAPAVSGALTPTAALDRLLAGSGLSYRFKGTSTVTIVGPVRASMNQMPATDGSLLLDTIDISGGRGNPTETPYRTPAPVSRISQESIERFRGSSPADIFRGTPGVMSGEARNGGGSIDVNIRGMQGMGRVAVTVDGAENGLTVYQGYQGISNRTYVDPDLLAGVDITKGADASSRGIAGTVAMRTLGADDVVKAGEKWGVLVRSGFGTNTATPRPGDLGGYTWPQPYVSDPQPYPVPTAQASGLNRPGLLDPTSGSFSTVAAIKEANYDLLWGYAYRKQGNYFAGKNGPGAGVLDTGPQPLCYSSGFCYYPPSPISYAHVYQNTGLTSYRAGEQVLNTQLETESYLAKGTVRSDDGQSLQVGYNGYRSKAGDVIASLFSSAQNQAVQQAQEDVTKVDTGTVRYRWKPEDNGLVDFKANMWMTSLSLLTPPRISLGTNVKPEDFGLPYGYLPGNQSTMAGGDVSNKSHVELDRFGSVDVEYGASYIQEATRPTPFTNQLNGGIPSRDGTRQEVAGFGKVAYKPVEWLTLNSGLRYSHYWSQDRSTITNARQVNSDPSRDSGGYSPSAGIVVEPIKDVQFYTNYSSALRMPTLFESVAGYSLVPNAGLLPERSNNWEAGVNLFKGGVFAASDKAMMKFGYFNWNVTNYVARMNKSFVDPTYGYTYSALQVVNIDRARFEGLEWSGRYQNGGFTAEVAANYYLNVEYCPTAGTCANSTLSGDYSANQVPPKYSANITLSQKLLDDDLTVGGRASYIGPRSIGYGAVQYGAAAIIAPIIWQPYWLVDVFAEYRLTKDISLRATVENLTDQYYVDPLSLVQQPSPGRTVRLGMTGKFGGDEAASPVSLGRLFASGATVANWTGFHAGVNAAYNSAKFSGTVTALDGSADSHAANEAPNQQVGALSFGLHAGYDYQFANRIVAGIEADIAKTEIGASQVTFATEGAVCNCSNNLSRMRQFEAVQQSEVKWLSTVRGRLGYAVNDRLMLYASGGVAFMQQDESRTQYRAVNTGNFAWPTTTVSAFTEDSSRTRVGYVIGGGGEFALGGAWSMKAEYLLARFSSEDFVFADARAGVLPGNFVTPATYSTSNGRKVTSSVDIPMVRVGVNYRF
ncbi:TonB-dependent receptor [Rhodopseudomonas palustris]|uniref:TonB-dependent receptor domain-containing protein n=1 Tax=Rhodopseudomonas palustris TaxID=1076 RepID=UPI0020CFA823|nr:TonB-dependent receptor [Rhodopseudomonas palustris]MCP9630527.1 TonB-dependent receptor [Rhodopseudomonas palustris]